LAAIVTSGIDALLAMVDELHERVLLEAAVQGWPPTGSSQRVLLAKLGEIRGLVAASPDPQARAIVEALLDMLERGIRGNAKLDG
jgi:hypothetical protein